MFIFLREDDLCYFIIVQGVKIFFLIDFINLCFVGICVVICMIELIDRLNIDIVRDFLY